MGTFQSIFCMIESLGSLAGFILGLCKPELWPPLWYVSLIFFVTHPILNECLLTIKGWMCKGSIATTPPYLRINAPIYTCIPIVYSTKYNISAFGLEKLHPFDASKYRRVFNDLV
jgi:hypothetical protein